MLTIIPNLPSFVFGIKASGKITEDDMKSILLPGLQQLVDATGEIYYLLELDTDVSSFTAGSWLQDIKAGLRHFSKWKKIAVVTDQVGVEKFTDIFSVLVPGESKGFKSSELAEAKEWICEKVY